MGICGDPPSIGYSACPIKLASPACFWTKLLLWTLSWSTTYRTPLSALALGDVGILFHPGELYSVYGLSIRRASPFADTIVVGYTDDLIGYVPDPKAYQAGEYAAVVVPKIVDLPCFEPDVGRRLAAAALELMTRAAR